jgi:hypothetical protein
MGTASPEPRAANGARRERQWKWTVLGSAIVLAAAGPFWVPPLLSRMSFFRVRRVAIEGAHFVAPRDLLARLHVDTTVSVWAPLGPLEERVAALPEVRTVAISRKLPGTLVVTITERVPVALVPTPQGFRAYDEGGLPLPIEPSKTTVDAPILARRDTAVLRLLGELRSRAPEFYMRVSEVRREDDELLLILAAFGVRTMEDVTVHRLEDLEPVERDLARRQLAVAELDLRFRDQVIARLK